MGCVVYRSKSQGIINLNPENLKRRVIQPVNTDIRKNYEFISMLGHGAFGKVRLYRDKNYKELLFAIKTLKKEGIPQYQFNLLKSEVSILSDLDHPNIVKYFGTFEDDYYIHILMEYLKGHDLNKIIALKKYTKFEEKDMAKIIEQLLKALSFIHSKQIVHRDIKPENILFNNKRDYSTLKLIDFGLATTKRDKKHVGTPLFMSPEMVNGESCPKSDIWAVGIIVYLMLTGTYPFKVDQDDENNNEENNDNSNNILYEKIKKKDYDRNILLDFSPEVQDFIDGCLNKSINNRFDSQDCLSHPWIKKNCTINDTNIIGNEEKNILFDFIKKSILQKEIYYFIAKFSKEKDLVKFTNFFNKLDGDKKGTLSIDDLDNGFKNIGIKISDEELILIWEGLDFHKDGKVNYSEFLAAMISCHDFKKEDKLSSVFNLFKENKKNKNYITYESLSNVAKALNLKIDEEGLKKCFKEYNDELKMEDFKKLILDDEEKDDKLTKEATKNGGASANKKTQIKVNF
jgi:calcium-dependent protein kinase